MTILARAWWEPLRRIGEPRLPPGTKMVMEAFGHARAGVEVGANILVRVALAEEFAGRTGEYFDNDIGRFGPPHPDAEDPAKREQIVQLHCGGSGRTAVDCGPEHSPCSSRPGTASWSGSRIPEPRERSKLHETNGDPII